MSLNSEDDEYQNLNSSENNRSIKSIVRWTPEEIDVLINSRINHNHLFSNKSQAHQGWKLVYQDLKNAGVSEEITFNLMKKKWTGICTRYRDYKNRNEINVNWEHYQKLDDLFSPLIKQGKTKLKLKNINQLREDQTIKVEQNKNTDIKPVLNKAELVLNHYLSIRKESKETTNKPMYILFTPNKSINEANEKKVVETEINTKDEKHPIIFVVEEKNDNIEPINTKCRLCQESDGVHSLREDTELRSRIEVCTSLKIDDPGILPISICDHCQYIINTFHKFLLKCQKIDQQLREIALEKNKKIDVMEEPQKIDKNEVDSEYEGSPEYLMEDFDELTENDLKNEKFEILVTNNQEDTEGIKVEFIDETKIENFNEEFIDIVQVDNINEQVQKSIEKGENECDLCGRTFSTSKFLNRHLKRHAGIKYACPRTGCNKKYSTLGALKLHDKTTHLGVLGRFMCATCGKHCANSSSLKSHELIHRTKTITCTVCSKKFSSINSMKCHRAYHHEGVRYYCSKCPKNFMSKMSLERHEIVHTGIKEFSCDTCPMQFYTEKELVRHLRIHKGIKPHRCSICFKGYVEKYSLYRHMASHTDERPYVCKEDGCGKSYKNKQKLKMHIQKNHLYI